MELKNPLYKDIGIHLMMTLFTIDNGIIKVLLIKRKNLPFNGLWALVGGALYNNEKLSNFIYKYWGDRKMIKTFPNIKVQDIDGNIIYIDSLLKDIKPYYFKFFEPKSIK